MRPSKKNRQYFIQKICLASEWHAALALGKACWLLLERVVTLVLRAWPFANRLVQVLNNVQLGERCRNLSDLLDVWLRLEHPNVRHDLRINLLMGIASAMVITISVATVDVMPENLLLIPTWALYAIVLVTYRGYRLKVRPA
jgi:hypothetical protein